ncbi:MAG: SCP2 sterol-binding domain-containing protein [Candidatus Bathyarchaeota archaeon]|nr:SCP2 sterol-binding domain-containing protein [Candidatus Bathyarchaeota archaeon]
MDAKTPKEFFDNELPSRFNPEKAADIDVVAQININGENSGNWVVTVRNQKIDVTEGVNPEAALTLEMDDDDFMDLVHDRLSAEKAFFTGRVKFKGSISLALKLREAGFL